MNEMKFRTESGYSRSEGRPLRAAASNSLKKSTELRVTNCKYYNDGSLIWPESSQKDAIANE